MFALSVEKLWTQRWRCKVDVLSASGEFETSKEGVLQTYTYVGIENLFLSLFIENWKKPTQIVCNQADYVPSWRNTHHV